MRSSFSSEDANESLPSDDFDSIYLDSGIGLNAFLQGIFELSVVLDQRIDRDGFTRTFLVKIRGEGFHLLFDVESNVVGRQHVQIFARRFVFGVLFFVHQR